MKRIKVNRAALFAIITSVGEFGLALSRYCDLSIIAYMVFGAATVYGAYNFACEGYHPIGGLETSLLRTSRLATACGR